MEGDRLTSWSPARKHIAQKVHVMRIWLTPTLVALGGTEVGHRYDHAILRARRIVRALCPVTFAASGTSSVQKEAAGKLRIGRRT